MTNKTSTTQSPLSFEEPQKICPTCGRPLPNSTHSPQSFEEPSPHALSDQEQVRLEKLARLREHGYPYPNDVSVTAHSLDIIQRVEEHSALDPSTRPDLTIAGRLMTIRVMGKAAFCHLQDASGQVQIYVKRDDVGEEVFAQFKSFDLGDIIEAAGYAFTTKTGEATLHVKRIRLLVKCLHPLPEKWHGLTDIETRYRQRYIDLIVNPDAKQVFLTRAKILSAIRRFFDARGYVEVETPMMSAVASGASAKPFTTHLNVLDLDLHLRIALELPLKRLVVGGIERVYELGRVFRNEGLSTEHNPEFTMLEFYEAYATYETFMDLTEALMVMLCDQILGSRTLCYKDTLLNFEPPWKRLSMIDAIHDIGEISREMTLQSLEGVKKAASQIGLEHLQEIDDYGLALYEIFDSFVEEKITHPTFITEFPLTVSPLSRPSMKDPRFVDRFELIVAGMELANAFSELNDPEDQRRRFEEQRKRKQMGDEEAMATDDDFITALEYGLPPTAGQGIGIDRLVMILTNSTSIRDVILFPQMRPLGHE